MTIFPKPNPPFNPGSPLPPRPSIFKPKDTVLRIKIFSSQTLGGLEKIVNEWLATTQWEEVTDIRYTDSRGYAQLVIMYTRKDNSYERSKRDAGSNQ